ncbi:hypothetical protein [Paenibacillus sp. Leaf72]|uniref:hypothetical protein n=1 Tax=Paenibacillus sp. Leaf72 TaxID=1736234 RepID=UPI0006FA5A50|nr:hypothetical protein [Paenibacillus sp. Leaf72]KQO18271.1 hypothetical protein ASF12_06475 [Paenibacillus sp. Leaf72]
MKFQTILAENTELKITTGFAGRFSVFINGNKIEKSNDGYLFPLNGETQQITVRRAMLDNVPKVTWNGREVLLAKKLKSYEWILSALPLLLLFLGGAVGGAIGAIAMLGNVNLFRSQLPTAAKVLLSLLISGSAFIVNILVAMFIYSMVNG